MTSTETLQQIKQLFDQNLGSRAIAKKLNMTRWAVQQAYKELGLYNIGRKKARTAHLATEKKCKRCEQVKPVAEFRKRVKGDRISYEVYCLPCEQEYSIQNSKKHYAENKDWWVKYREENLDKIHQYDKEYRQKNKQILASKANQRRKDKRKTDPVFKLRERFSISISTALRKFGGSKNGSSFLKHLPYSIVDLRAHLEKQFKPWMNWENYGRYLKKTWNDNDQSTWTWQIDHIIPASTFTYTSMTDPDFQKCWALENLRPLTAKQNLIEGTQRLRH